MERSKVRDSGEKGSSSYRPPRISFHQLSINSGYGKKDTRSLEPMRFAFWIWRFCSVNTPTDHNDFSRCRTWVLMVGVSRNHPENMKNMFTKRNDNSPELIREIFIEGYDYRRILREWRCKLLSCFHYFTCQAQMSNSFDHHEHLYVVLVLCMYKKRQRDERVVKISLNRNRN